MVRLVEDEDEEEEVDTEEVKQDEIGQDIEEELDDEGFVAIGNQVATFFLSEVH